MRLSVISALSCIALSSVGVTQPAGATTSRKMTEIPAQPLGSALERLARDRDLQLFYATDEVSPMHSPGATGNLTASDALAQLLRGTGLTYRFLDDHTVTVQTSSSVPQHALKLAVVARADAPQPAVDPAATEEGPTKTAGLEEIIVTAQKRAERLQDVPIPMTVIGASDLAETNHFRLQDYSSQVPGLSVTSSDSAGSPRLGIRGISPAPFGNPTVGVTLDGVPLGSEIAFGGGSVTPELDPSDLKQIEVLRGPQGTLYGAASMGGLLKYETVDPSMTQLDGRVDVGSNFVHNGRHPGYDMNGAVNVPISDSFAARASAFARWAPGYIDNVQTGERGVNGTQITGGFLSALWRPVGTFSLKLNALFQDTRLSGEPLVMLGPGFGDLQQAFMPNAGAQNSKFETYSAIADWKLGSVELTSVTGYNNTGVLTPLDNTLNLGQLVSVAYPTSNAFEVDYVRSSKFTQELRVATPLGKHLQWLIGAYFSHELPHSYTKYVPTRPDSTPLGTFANLESQVRFTEWAGFTDLTYLVTDRFDIQFGARASRMKQSFVEVDSGPYLPMVEGLSSPTVYPEVAATESATTYLLTPRFKITPDVMVYARYATGFRPGGTNVGVIPPGAQRDFNPDKTQNYEAGVKADLLDHKLYLEGALYRIDWRDIQVFLEVPGTTFGYYSNGSRAKTQGVELSANARPLPGLRTGAWVSLNEAVLTQGMPANSVTYGVSGDKLPFSSRFSASASADYDIAMRAETLSLGATLSYVGERTGAFMPTAQREVYPGYASVDFHTSLTFGRFIWSVYVNNAFDRRGIVGGGLGSYFPNAFDIIQPRTVGSSLARAF